MLTNKMYIIKIPFIRYSFIYINKMYILYISMYAMNEALGNSNFLKLSIKYHDISLSPSKTVVDSKFYHIL